MSVFSHPTCNCGIITRSFNYYTWHAQSVGGGPNIYCHLETKLIRACFYFCASAKQMKVKRKLMPFYSHLFWIWNIKICHLSRFDLAFIFVIKKGPNNYNKTHNGSQSNVFLKSFIAFCNSCHFNEALRLGFGLAWVPFILQFERLSTFILKSS